MRLSGIGYKILKPALITSALMLFALPVFAATIIENFDTYTLTCVDSQGGWTADCPQNGLDVSNTHALSSPNSIRLLGNAYGNSGYRNFTAPSDNFILSSEFYITSLGQSNETGSFSGGIVDGIRNSDTGADSGILHWSKNDLINNPEQPPYSWIFLNNLYLTPVLDDSILNAWHKAEIEIIGSTHQARFRIDGGVWSAWGNFAADPVDYHYLNQIFINNGQYADISTPTAYVDNYSITDLSTPTPPAAVYSFETPTSTASNLLAAISSQFADVGTLGIIVLSASVLLSFWGLEKIIELTPKK